MLIGIDGDSKELRRFVATHAVKMRTHLDDMSTAVQRFIDVGELRNPYARALIIYRANSELQESLVLATLRSGRLQCC